MPGAKQHVAVQQLQQQTLTGRARIEPGTGQCRLADRAGESARLRAGDAQHVATECCIEAHRAHHAVAREEAGVQVVNGEDRFHHEVLIQSRHRLLLNVHHAILHGVRRGRRQVLHQEVDESGLGLDVRGVERELARSVSESQVCERLRRIPGVGLLTATAAVATVGDAKVFSSGREFAAFLGLVPRQSGTGGRVKLLGISKRGDGYLRRLLIHGARAVITHAKARDPWVEALLARRPLNAVVVALANKMARTIWALLAHGRHYEPRGQALGCRRKGATVARNYRRSRCSKKADNSELIFR